MRIMNIQLSKIHKIKSDAYNYTLVETTLMKDDKGKQVKDDEGNIKYRVINKGYYTTLSNALKAYLDLNIKKAEKVTIEELIQVIQDTESTITETVIEHFKDI